MRFVLLILLVISGIDFGAKNETQGGDFLRCRLFRFHSRCKCCVRHSQSFYRTSTTCAPGTPVVAPAVQATTETAEESETKEVDWAAQLVTAIDQSKNLSWTVTHYVRWTSKDGERTWLEVGGRSEMAFQAPNLFRDTRYDAKGNVIFVQIVDTDKNQTLHLDMRSKKAMRMDQPINVYQPGHPLGWLSKMLQRKPPTFVEQQKLDGHSVAIYRCVNEPPKPSIDIWLDATTQQLVGISNPGADKLDPTTVVERSQAPGRNQRGRRRPAGRVESDIVFDAPLQPDLFSFAPPEGFEVAEAPPSPNG